MKHFILTSQNIAFFLESTAMFSYNWKKELRSDMFKISEFYSIYLFFEETLSKRKFKYSKSENPQNLAKRNLSVHFLVN